MASPSLQTHASTHPLQPLHPRDLDLICGGGPGGWGIGASLQGGAMGPMAAAIDLTYHTPNLSVTGSLATRGRQLEAGLAAQGTLRNNGSWSGGFSTDGHNWNANLQVKVRF